MVMSILKGIMAVVNVIPVIKQIIDTIINAYYNYKNTEIEKEAAEKEEELNNAINQANNAQTDEDRINALNAIVNARK